MSKVNNNIIEALFEAGAHFGFVKSRRHPSAKPFILGAKNKTEIFDLEKTVVELEKALNFVEGQGKAGTLGLFVGGKSEAREATQKVAQSLGMPFVSGRWIGGTLTNFVEIKKRIAKLEELTTARERGELAKYTKKERLLIDREIENLREYFSGLSTLKALPKFIVIVDPKKESIAVAEAKRMRIPVIALTGSDNDLHSVDFAIPANDSSRQTIHLILSEVAKAYQEGLAQKKDDNNGTN